MSKNVASCCNFSCARRASDCRSTGSEGPVLKLCATGLTNASLYAIGIPALTLRPYSK